jgi:esterase/lipase
VIHKYDKPLLMLHGKSDLYSLPSEAEKLYDKCPSEHKNIVWFEGGKHSQLRYQNTELYDQSISEFIDSCYIRN